ncbi:MAG: hypothetical protein J2P48_07655 [Alphaproteobacteria bacterium]|nr:hypothetical protein [Alphaproteobacteria bacterium]
MNELERDIDAQILALVQDCYKHVPPDTNSDEFKKWLGVTVALAVQIARGVISRDADTEHLVKRTLQ